MENRKGFYTSILDSSSYYYTNKTYSIYSLYYR